MAEKTLFISNQVQQAPIAFVEVTPGPGAGVIWKVESLFVASKASVSMGVKLKLISVPLAGEALLFNNTNIYPGETVSIGPVTLMAGESLSIELTGGDVDVIGVGQEI